MRQEGFQIEGALDALTEGSRDLTTGRVVHACNPSMGGGGTGAFKSSEVQLLVSVLGVYVELL